MKFEDLSPQDQALVNTDFGDMDKVAEEMVKEAAECYDRGFEKTALEIADGLDKAAKEEKEDKEEEEELDHESEKKAAELAAFYERGVFDGLAKLGEARYGDEMHYFWPFIEEKIASEGAKGAVMKFLGKMKGHMGSAAEAAKQKAKHYGSEASAAGARAKQGVKDYHHGAAENLRQAATGRGKAEMGVASKLTAGERAKAGLKGAAKFSPHALAVGGAAAGAHHLATKKD